MELIPVLSTVLMVATLVTILFAFFSYIAFRYRERKKPVEVSASRTTAPEPRFFRRYHPPPAG